MPHSPATPPDIHVREILRAAASWAREAPVALTPAITAVTIRLAEMVADQRHYRPEAGGGGAEVESLDRVAELLRGEIATRGLDAELEALGDLELRTTGSWAAVPSAHAEWAAVAVDFLAARAARLTGPDRPDRYWADDVVAGITASVRAILGVDQLLARTEAQYQGVRRGPGGGEVEAER
ncbi:MAG TPA: hypothetical protein VJ773_00355 [Gemmatimonadales bacterium]|nr:hypothetical protein [Gemmatimonadales bacterium]